MQTVVVGLLRAVVGPPAESPRRAAKVGGEPPEWIQIFPFGEYKTDHQESPYLVDEEAMDEIVASFAARGNDLVIDYEHQTLDDVQAPAAGWIKELEARGEDGLWARVEWTTKAQEYLRSGEYRYDSPVFAIDKKSKRVTALLNLALTNWPASHNRTALTEQIAAKARVRFHVQATAREGVMNQFADNLKYWLNLKTTSTNNEVRAELQKVLNSIPADDQLIYAKAAGETDKTLAELAGCAPLSAAKPPDAIASKAVLDELELPETATLAQIQAKVIEMKSPAGMVPAAKLAETETQLQAARAEIDTLKTTGAKEQLEKLIVANRKKIPPAKESAFRELAAKHGIAHAGEVLKFMKEELPSAEAAQSTPAGTTVPEVETQAGKTMRVGQKDVPVDPDSATRAAKVRAIQKEDPKFADYRVATQELERREIAAAK